MESKKFNVTGMTCSSCSAHVEKSVSKLEGVKSVNVNLLTNSMTVDYDEKIADSAEIVKAVQDGGYNAFEADKKIKDKKQIVVDSAAVELKEMKSRLIISTLFLLPLFYISMGHMMSLPLPSIFLGRENAMTYAFTQFILTIPVVFVNFKYFRVGFKTLFKGSPNMDSLIAIGSAAAVVYGSYAIYKIGYGLGHADLDLVHHYAMDLYFESAAMILTLITLGKYLEARAKGKTSEAISKLVNLSPKTALVERNGQEIEIGTDEVVVGDIIVVKPGQSVPVDGVITEGSTSVDESALTGESIPVEKKAGDKVIGASINKSGYIKFKAQKVGGDTTLSEIIRLVEEASSSKAPISKLADRVSRVFVPAVIAIAAITFVTWLALGYSLEFAMSVSIAVLVISCPCALGLATPTAIMVGTGKGAENGILIKSAEALETLHSINTVVLDKTGTITEGKPKVTDIITGDGITENELLKLAYSLEKLSEHPLADAINKRAQELSLQPFAVQSFEAIHGEGITGTINGENYYAGNLKLMKRSNINYGTFEEKGTQLANKGKTPLYFADSKKILGIVAVADTIKPTSKAAVKELEAMGIEVVMLTGDNKRTAEAIKDEVGINRVVAEVMPQDKDKEVRNIQSTGKKVAMIGDGINDSPALARADVGIAIGAGTDVAIESADIVLMKSDLLDAVGAIKLSKSTIRNIKQNLFWALFYNTVGIPLAAGVFYSLLGWKLNPMFAAAAMSLSSVSVVSNALRLKLFKPKYHSNIDLTETQNKKLKGEENMKKTIIINGMSCGHCSGRVEKALNGIDGVSATVSLEEKCAHVTLTKDVSDEILKNAVIDAGYEVVEIR